MQRLMVVAVLALVVGACSGAEGEGAARADGDGSSSTTAVVAEYEPVYETVPCDGELFAGRFDGLEGVRGVDRDRFECGTLTVPEDRTRPDGRDVVLPVATLRADAPDKQPDPYVYFSGGPGDAGIEAGVRVLAAGLVPTSRDFIFSDQRGTGRATPSLYCPNVIEHEYRRFETTDPPEAEDAAGTTEHEECAERVRAGADLDQYDTPTTARDVDDLRVALGLDEWNIFGISYGTAVAMEVLRSHPEGVRSAVLDSVFPPSAEGDDTEFAELVDGAVQTLVDGCLDDAACAERYPDLEADIGTVIDDLNESPHRLTYVDHEGQERTANLTGDDVLEAAFGAMYDSSLIPLLPSFVAMLRAGDTTPLDLIAERLPASQIGISDLAYDAVQCADRAAIMETTTRDELAEDQPRAVRVLGAPELPAFCDTLGVERVDEGFREVPVTEVPTLVVAGEYDPVTPPSYARGAAEDLGDAATFVEFPGIGHGATRSDPCAMAIFHAFLDEPTAEVDTTCVGEMTGPEWVLLPG